MAVLPVCGWTPGVGAYEPIILHVKYIPSVSKLDLSVGELKANKLGENGGITVIRLFKVLTINRADEGYLKESCVIDI